MEGLSSLKGLSSNGTSRTRKVVPPEPSSDDLSSLLSNESGEEGVKHRIGARRRAFAQVDAAFDRAQAEGWDMDTLRAHIVSLENVASNEVGGGGKTVVIKVRHLVGLSKTGNRIYLNNHKGEVDALKSDFSELYSFRTRNGAMYYVDTANNESGTRIF